MKTKTVTWRCKLGPHGYVVRNEKGVVVSESWNKREAVVEALRFAAKQKKTRKVKIVES